MKNTIIKLMIVVLMMGLMVFQGQAVLAQDEAAVEEMVVEEMAVPEVVAEVTIVAGKLVAVDLENSAITVEQTDVTGEISSVVLTANATTTIMKAGVAVTLGDLVVDEIVTAEGMVDESGNLVASSIVVE